MNLQLIKKMCENREGGLKKLAMDINMSEANLHRCLNNNKIQATDFSFIPNLFVLINSWVRTSGFNCTLSRSNTSMTEADRT